MPKRVFSTRELNHLRKFGYSNIDLDSLGKKPVEYVTGHAEFLGLDFLVTPDILIPRIESEEIVQTALNFIDQNNLTHPFIADIGTGSGCLGLTLATKLVKKQIPYSIFLSDISPKALVVARQNAKSLLESPANLFFLESDLLENYPKIKFDIIMANLPYIPSKIIPALDPSVKDFEPLSALDGGTKGTKIINRLLSTLPSFLSQKAIAVFEIDDTQTLSDFTIPANLSVDIKKDIFGVPRFLILTPNL